MKKLFLVALMAVFTSSAFAQLITSNRTVYNKSHNVWVDFGVGTYTGDWNNTGVGLDLGFRYTKMFTDNIGWDIVKFSVQTDTKNFSNALYLQGKTGLRVVSPVVFGESKIYANFAGGYGRYFGDIKEGGFAWEIGAGLNVTPRFAVGINYNSCNYKIDVYRVGKETVKVGLLSLRVAYAL